MDEPQSVDVTATRRRAALTTLRADAAAVEGVTALRGAGMDPIVLKGRSFATLLYPEGGRTYADADLLVNPRDKDAAREAVAALGYVSTQGGYAPSERDKESETFVRSETGAQCIDLHWNLHLAGDPEQTWAVLHPEREPMSIGDLQVQVLSVRGRALHVAMHAAQHGLHGPERFERGGGTGEDLRRALNVIDRSTWGRAAELAAEIDAMAAFAFGLRLMPRGREIADALDLPSAVPDLAQFRSPFETARGATSVTRVATARTTRDKAAIVARMVVPSRARVRKVADTRVGQASLAGAYLEYWWDAVRGAPSAITDSRALRLHQRRIRDEASESPD